MKLKTILFTAFAGMLLLTSCQKALTTFSIDTQSVTLTSAGETKDVNITAIMPSDAKANFTWTSDHPEFVTVEKTGDRSAKLTAVANGTATITVAGSGISKNIAVTVNIGGINPGNATVIYQENFGNAATASPWPWVADYQGYERGGIGGAAAKYTQENGGVSIRGNNQSNNNGYDGASGACNAMMAAAGASFVIKDIATCGARNFAFSFGCGQRSDSCSVYYRVYNTEEWIELPYTKEDNYWGYVANLPFTVPAGTNTISIKFTAVETGYGVRVDDLKLITNDATSSPVIDVEAGIEPPACEVVNLPVNGIINGAIPNCWTYITNNVAYPDPTFYTTAGKAGLKLNFENMGITSPEFNPQSSIKVTINIYAFNANTKTSAASTDIFTVKGYNASGAEVGSATLTAVVVGENVVNLTGTDIVKVDVIMTGFPQIGATYQNVNLGGVKLETGARK